ncbi:hypothetical protein EAO77_19130 [Streptomyces sp. t39]|nr:hypothetical protein EAO77_19130 [Streptomyces sp. t39]
MRGRLRVPVRVATSGEADRRRFRADGGTGAAPLGFRATSAAAVAAMTARAARDGGVPGRGGRRPTPLSTGAGAR